MKYIQEAVRGYLEQATGVCTVADRTRVRGEYPLLAISVQENGTTLLAGGKLAEHTYQVTVTAASDREREENTALLASLSVFLLRGIPMQQGTETRVLHPLNISSQEDTLTFSLELCVPIPPLPEQESSATESMTTLLFDITKSS